MRHTIVVIHQDDENKGDKSTKFFYIVNLFVDTKAIITLKIVKELR